MFCGKKLVMSHDVFTPYFTALRTLKTCYHSKDQNELLVYRLKQSFIVSHLNSASVCLVLWDNLWGGNRFNYRHSDFFLLNNFDFSFVPHKLLK